MGFIQGYFGEGFVKMKKVEKTKGNKNARAGYRVENRFVNYLKEKRGFDVAVRSAGSHSPVDVWGLSFPRGLILIAQCKKHKKLVDKKNSEMLKILSEISRWIIACDVWPDRKEKTKWHIERLDNNIIDDPVWRYIP